MKIVFNCILATLIAAPLFVFIFTFTLKTSISPNQLGVTGPDKAKMADNFIPTLVVI